MRITAYLMAVLLGTVLVSPAQAYVGPGLGLGTLGAIGGFLLSILIAIVAVVWFPLKRMMGKKKTAKPASGQMPVSDGGTDA